MKSDFNHNLYLDVHGFWIGQSFKINNQFKSTKNIMSKCNIGVSEAATDYGANVVVAICRGFSHNSRLRLT